MVDQKDITYNEFRKANRTPLPKPEDIHQPGVRGPAQYFVDYVKQQLVDRYGTRKVFGGGLVVKTSIDLALQQRARNAISKWLHGPNMPTAALVALDPRDGRVLAMVGGQNYRQSQFNLAVQGERQPGSSFKPFVLTTALEQGISPATTLDSKPVTIALGDRNWYVHNYEGSNLGWIDLTSATAYSDNTVYAQLTNIVQPRNVAATARKLGVTRKLNPYFAIGLGADPVSPLEMARAFSAFAYGGKRIDGALLKNRPRVVLAVNGKTNGAEAPARSSTRTTRGSSPTSSRRSSSTEPASGQRSPIARWPGRPGRPRTTATRGSSATRRRWSSPSGSAIRTRCGRC